MNNLIEHPSLQTFSSQIAQIWGPLATDVVAGSRRAMEELLRTPATEPWLAALHREEPGNRELLRDPERGFVLLAHTERSGIHRPPHDHGRAWVIYGVQRGEVEMGTFGRIVESDGRVRLVQRDATVLRAGEARAFLPGDIHDTRCLSSQALLFRFTERDLKKEDEEGGRITRYVQRGGIWTVGER